MTSTRRTRRKKRGPITPNLAGGGNVTGRLNEGLIRGTKESTPQDSTLGKIIGVATLCLVSMGFGYTVGSDKLSSAESKYYSQVRNSEAKRANLEAAHNRQIILIKDNHKEIRAWSKDKYEEASKRAKEMCAIEKQQIKLEVGECG